MSVYICEAVTKFKDAHSEHQAHGVQGKRAPMFTGLILAIRALPIFGFLEYISSFYRQVASVILNKDVSITDSAVVDFNTVTDLPFTNYPPIVFVMTEGRLTKEEMETLGAHPQKTNSKQQGYQIPKPDSSTLSKIAAINNINQDYAPKHGYSGIRAFKGYILLRKLVNAFLATYCPPEDSLLIEGKPYLQDNTYDTDEKVRYVGVSEGLLEGMLNIAKRKLGDEEGQVHAEKKVRIDDKSTVGPPSKFRITFRAGLRNHRIIPSSIGPASNYPERYGITFPHFDRMADASLDGILFVVQRLFFSNLGGESVAFLTLKSLRENDSFIRTHAGNALCHMFRGIQMAIDAQCGLYLLNQNGSYGGFVLYGNHFFVSNNGVRVNPVSPREVREVLSSIGSHDIALQKICHLINRVNTQDRLEGTTDAMEEVYTVGQIDTPCKLQNVIWPFVSRMTMAQKEELVSIAGDLSYKGFDYAKVDTPTLINFINAVNDGVEDLMADYNVYFANGAILETTFVGRLLLRFGPMCPTLSHPGSKHVHIALDAKTDPLIKQKEVIVKVKDKETKVMRADLSVLYVNRVSLDIARKDWEDIIEKGSFAHPLTKYTKKERSNMSEFEGDNFNALWSALRVFYVVPAKKEPATVDLSNLVRGKGVLGVVTVEGEGLF